MKSIDQYAITVYPVVSNKISAKYSQDMLRLTPQQVAEVSRLSDQTLRHWRSVLPPLAGLNGYTPCFTPGDALALLVVRHLVKVMGISVGTLAGASSDLFSLCRSTSWPHLADRHLLIQIEQNSVILLTREPDLEAPAILVPMRPFAEQLQAAWASSFPALEQLPLQFGATVVPRSARAAGA
ncbi:hypothetical protein [Paraburkholderia tropica]|uniref:hypothetical protein n=1 Tax=Paraburkholderia tropica TaxID=92647 RepID=UPI002AB0973B|nr:hypothetical protein [Paraburkholderia tropica]